MFGIAIDTWGHCRHLRLESLQEVIGTIDAQGHWESIGLGSLQVSATVKAQSHRGYSWSWWTLSVTVDAHGQGRCSGQKQQAWRPRMGRI